MIVVVVVVLIAVAIVGVVVMKGRSTAAPTEHAVAEPQVARADVVRSEAPVIAAPEPVAVVVEPEPELVPEPEPVVLVAEAPPVAELVPEPEPEPVFLAAEPEPEPMAELAEVRPIPVAPAEVEEYNPNLPVVEIVELDVFGGSDSTPELAEVVADLIDAADPVVAEVMAKLIDSSDPVLVARLVDDPDLGVAEVVARLLDEATPEIAEMVAQLADSPERRQVAEVLSLVDAIKAGDLHGGDLDPEVAKRIEELDVDSDLDLTSRPAEMGFGGLGHDDRSRILIRVLAGLVARDDLPRATAMPRDPASEAETRRWPMSRARWPLPPPDDEQVVQRDPLPARRDDTKAS